VALRWARGRFDRRPGFAAPNGVARRRTSFPGGKGDVRDEMVQIIARDAKRRASSSTCRCIRGASLFKPNEQWNALVNGQLTSRRSRSTTRAARCAHSAATLMPALVRSHERAARINNSAFMQEIKAKIDKAG